MIRFSEVEKDAMDLQKVSQINRALCKVLRESCGGMKFQRGVPPGEMLIRFNERYYAK